MKRTIILLVLILQCSLLHAQTVRELYENRKYPELVKLNVPPDKLSAVELYMIGFAHYRLSDDAGAIEYYDRAIAKGLDEGYVHFYKGLSLYYQKKYVEALPEINTALQREPRNQEYMNQKGLIYKYTGKDDSALLFFETAVRLPNTFGEPFYWVAYSYHQKNDYGKALRLYYIAADSVPKSNSYYVKALKSIGQLEYSHTKDYQKSARAYAKAIIAEPENYELYYKLMKSYNAAAEYTKADSVFRLVKAAFEQGKLPEEDMELKTVAIAQFAWKGRTAAVRRSLIEPKNDLDISYKVFVLNEAGDQVERRFVIEKTLPLGDDIKYVLCEQDKKNHRHITYPYGFTTDNIPVDKLERAVKLVLDGKLKGGASSASDEY